MQKNVQLHKYGNIFVLKLKLMHFQITVDDLRRPKSA